MDLRTLTKLVLKLAGLYILVSALLTIPSIVVAPQEFILVSYTSIALWCAFGLALLWFPGAVANHVIRIDAGALEGAASAIRVLRIGIILLGFFFLITGASRLVFAWATTRLFYYTVGPLGFQPPELSPDEFASYVANVLQCCLGLALWLWSKWFATVSWRNNNDR